MTVVRNVGLAQATTGVEDLIREATVRVGGLVAVAVDGRSGAGKTTLGRAIAAATGGHLLSMEGLYPGWDGLAEAARRVVTDVLEPLARGDAPGVRRWDWAAGAEQPWRPLDLGGCAVLVIEGVGSSPGGARPYLGVRVWLDGDPEVRRTRALRRDGDAYAPHWRRWADQEVAYIAREHPERHADLVIASLDGP